MKILRNKTRSVQFLRIKYDAIKAISKSAAPSASIQLTDPEYAFVFASIDPNVWQVTHIDDMTPDTVQEVNDLIAAAPGAHTHANLTILNGTQESFTTALKTAYDGAVVNPHATTYYVDDHRTDIYTADGSAAKPFKTIAAALAQIVTNGDQGSVPYAIMLASGTYAETINLNNRGLFNITFAALGRVAIVPVAGNSVTATTGISALQDLHFYGIEFGCPIVITGDGTTDQFKNVNFRDCAFSGLANATFTCMNSIAIWNLYCETLLTFSNVNYLYMNGGQVQQTFSMTMNSANTAPSWGVAGGAIIFDLVTGDVALTVSGLGAVWNLSTHGCRMGGSTGVYTIPANCNVQLYNSLLRGTWTNNGALTLKNSNMENVVAGTAPVYTANKSNYVNYAAGTPANWAVSAPISVKSAIDRIAAAVFATSGAIP
jgi:hypothetical protein